MNLLKRLWNSSPASLTAAVRRRWERRGDRPGWYPIRGGPLAGVEMYLESTRLGIGAQLLAGDYDSFFEDEALRGVNMQNKVFWDIGAHIGYHSLWMSHRGARVVAFEPNPHNAACFRMILERNKALADRIELKELALCDRDGEMTFRYSPLLKGESAGGHLTTARPPLREQIYEQFESASVPTGRIDGLLDAGAIPPADVVKIDVEGAEDLVLQGGQTFFQTCRPVILMEVHHILLMMQVQERLSAWGYRLRLLDEKNASPSRCFITAEPVRA